MPKKGTRGTIALDYSHNNKLIVESSSFQDFTNFLFTSGYKLGKIQAGFDSLKKLEQYDCIILSSPNNSKLSDKEIEVLEKYVNQGGNLLILSSMGGDHTNRTNLNELTKFFRFEFVSDTVEDSMNYLNLQRRPLITNITPHIITDQVKKIVFSSACSVKALEFLEDNEDIKVEIVANGGLNTWHRVYDGKDWIEEDSPKIPLLVAVEYYEGRVVAIGNLSMFSSLGREYGFSAFDNNLLIANILKFLTSDVVSEGKVITINLNLDLFHWTNKILNEQDWENVSDVINLAVKYFKDNYSDAIKEIKRMREEKLARRIAYEKAQKKIEEETSEDKILEMIPVRKREDLEDIMSALEEVTGEKYEMTIDLDEVEEKAVEEVTEKKVEVEEETVEEVTEEKVEVEEETVEEVIEEKVEVEEEAVEEKFIEIGGIKFTIEETKEFKKQSGGRHHIWHGKLTKAFKEWLEEKRKREKISALMKKEN